MLYSLLSEKISDTLLLLIQMWISIIQWLILLPMHYETVVLEGTECTAAWCIVDNWQPLICGVYFGRELKESNNKRQVVLVRGLSLLKFLR